MLSVDSSIFSVDVATSVVEFAVNWFLQSTLLIGTGLALGAFLRQRGSAFQSVVYRTTLAAVLVCPLATWGLDLLGVSGWSVQLPAGWALVQAEPETAFDLAPLTTPAEQANEPSPETYSQVPDNFARRGEFSPNQQSNFVAAELPPFPAAADVEQIPNAVTSPATQEMPFNVPTVEQPLEVPTVQTFGVVSLILGALWLAVALGMSIRLAIAWRGIRRLQKRAVSADSETLGACHQLATELQVRTPPVRRSPYLPSPCLAGLRRPTILLPDVEPRLQLRDVLVHELAHLKRHDCHWNLLRRLATAVFFFQPLLWKLSSLMESTAEEVCDDYVVAFGGDRQEYAHRLVDIAELSTASMAAAGVGIVSLRSMLAKRVTRILDTSRVLSTRVGNFLLLLVLLGGLIGTGIVGLVGIDHKESQAKVEVEETDPEVSDNLDENTNGEKAANTISVQGKVLDPDGKPVPGARVYADWVFVGDGRRNLVHNTSTKVEHKILAETVCDASGEFSLNFSTETPEPGRLSLSWQIVAYAPGMGAAWATDVEAWKDRTPTLQLTRDAAVRGRIVDLEGKPLAGVHVRVHGVFPAKSEQAIVDWIATSHDRTPPAELSDYTNMSVTGASGIYPEQFPNEWQDGRLSQGAAALPAEVSTDQQGRFQLQGIGADRLVMLEVESPEIAKCYLHVVNRDMEQVSAKPHEHIGVRSGTYFGREFEFVAEPSQPVEGTVTDLETGEPLAGVEVRLGQFAGNLFAQSDFLTTTTDEKGHYHLVGAPQGGGHRIDVDPSTDQPYFLTDKTLSAVSASFESIQCDFALRKGKWISGTVTESKTGEPVGDVTVEYLPLRDNQFVPNYSNYDPEITGATPEDRYRTDEKGTFRVLGIPGAGVIGAIAQGEDEQKFSRLSKDQVPNHLVGEGPRLNTYHPWTLVGYNALREVEVPESEEEVQYNLQLTRGGTRKLNLIDTTGLPAVGARVLGRTFPPHLEKPLEGSELELIGLRENDERIVAILHPERRIGKTLKVGPTGGEDTIQLEPCAVARGRFVNEDGESIRDVEVAVSIEHSDNWGRHLLGDSTDEEGRFEVLLPPGTVYRVFHYTSGGLQFSVECEPRPGALFDLGDLVDGTKLTVEQTAGMMVAAAKPQATEEEDLITVRGTVVDPDGKPVEGATVRLPNDLDESAPTVQTDSEGRFAIPFDKSKYPDPEWQTEKWQRAKLFATAPGYGPAWISGEDLNSTEDLKMQLVRDEPLRGQILDLEGRPVPLAQLEILHVLEPYSGSLDDYLAIVRDDPRREQDYGNNECHYLPPQWLDLQGPLKEGTEGLLIMADDQGRFELSGIGSERLVRFRVEGTGIESLLINVVTRGEIADQWKRGGLTDMVRRMLDSGSSLPKVYPATFKYLAGPSTPITGVVRDKDTGEPLAGILVRGWLRNTGSSAMVITDENGGYELTGIGIEGTLQQLYAGPSEQDANPVPYLGAERRQISFSPSNPLTSEDTDFELMRGLVVRGSVVDGATGEPVKARVEYFAHPDNPHLQELAEPLWRYGDVRTDDQGQFSIVVLPGPGALAVWTRLHPLVPDRYRPATPEQFGLPLDDRDRGLMNSANKGLSLAESYTAAMPIDIQRVSEAEEVKLVVHPVATVARVRCVDPQGLVIQEVAVAGKMLWSGDGLGALHAEQEVGRGDSTYIEISDLDAKDRKPVYFYERDRDLTALLFPEKGAGEPRIQDLPRDADSAHRITLRPSGRITGHLVDAEGNPVRNTRILVALSSAADPAAESLEIDDAVTYLEGEFELKHIPAGGPYQVIVAGASNEEQLLKQNLHIKPGEPVELGTIDISKDAKTDPTAHAEPANGDLGAALPQEAENDDLITVRGTVVDPSGQPLPHADVAVLRWYWDVLKPKPLAEAKADDAGRFEISYRKSQFFEDAGRMEQWREVYVVAFAEGLGPGWVQYEDLAPGEEVEIQLAVDDVPIEGRIVDAEGQPVVGATIEMGYLNAPQGENLDEWLEAVKGGQSIMMAAKYFSAGVPMFTAGRWQDITTDTDGRFTLQGIGRERQVKIHVKHPAIVTATLAVATRLMDPISHPAYDYKESDTEIEYGAKFEYAAATSRPYEGVITDAETGKPIEGAEVWSNKFAGTTISGIHTIKIKTDENGRYRLEGLPKGDGNDILVVPKDLPYFTAKFDLPNPPGLEPAPFDMKLHRGVWISGKVTDDETGKPVSARMLYMAPPDNPLAAQLPEFEYGIHTMWVQDRYQTDRNGNYRVVALPGRAVIGVNVISSSYPTGQGYEQIADHNDRDGYRKFNGVFGPNERSPTAVKEVQVPEEGGEVICDFVLDPGRRVAVHVTDPAGDPLAEVVVDGSRGISDGSRTMSAPEFEIAALREDETRTVLLHHEERGLGKALHVKAAESDNGTLEVRLEPCATVTGRLLKDGEPISGAMLRFDIWNDGDYGQQISKVTTDLDGRFTHQAVLPGLPYEIFAEGAKMEFAIVTKKLEVHAGETIDLGTIDITTDQRPEPLRSLVTAMAPNSGQPAAEGKTLEYAGKVLAPDGNPVAGAEIYLSYWVLDALPDFRAKPKAITNAQGEFKFKVEESDFADGEADAFSYARLIAKAQGYGFASVLSIAFETTGQAEKRLSPEASDYYREHNKNEDRTLRLILDDTPIKGTIIDADGQPVEGARLRVDRLWWNESGSLDAWDTAAKEEKADFYSLRAQTPVLLSGPHLAMAVPEVLTNAQGEFVLRGVGSDRIVQLMISGPQIETKLIKSRTRAGDAVVVPHEWKNRNGMGLPDETYYPAQFTYVAGPSRPVVGKIVDADSKQPIPGVRVSAGFQGTFVGSGKSYIATTTDDQGNYRLEGLSVGQRERISVQPPPGTAYLPVGAGITTGLHPEETRRDFQLKRGILIRGQAIDDRTGKPVPGRVQYVADQDNPYLTDYREFSRGEFHECRTDSAGKFEIPVLPGRGIVTFMALEHQSYRRGFGTETITVSAQDEQDGVKMFRTVPFRLISSNEHVLRQVEPEVDSPPLDIEMRLSSGVDVVGRLADPSGKPLEGGIVSGAVFSNTWYPIRVDTFRVEGYYEDRPRDLFFYHPERDLGGYYHLEGAPPEALVVKLQETGRIRGRIIDGEGVPLEGLVLRGEGVPNENYGNAEMRLGTDAEGRFEIRGLLPGRQYTVQEQSGRVALKNATVEAGETKDVGDVQLQAAEDVAREEAEPSPKVAAVEKEMPFQYVGQVVDAQGQGVQNAKLYLAYWYSDQRLPPSVRPLATTDTDGRFEFNMAKSDFRRTGDSVPPWLWASIVAVADGHGAVWANSVAFEKTGAALREAEEGTKTRGISIEELRRRLEADRGPLRLVQDAPIEGQMVDINGQPIAGATVQVSEIRTGRDDTLDAWGVAVKKPGINLYQADQAAEKYLYGPMIPEIFARTTTDDDGHFTIRGLGQDRLVNLVVSAEGFETQEVHTRLRSGDTILLDHSLAGKVSVHGPSFTNVMGPSRAVEGVVRDEKTGEPLADVLVTSRRVGTNFADGQTHLAGSEHVRAETDSAGRYRLTGLPSVERNPINFQPVGEQLYLPTFATVDTSGSESDAVKLDVKLAPAGGVVVGRVVDKQTGQGISGRILYLASDKEETAGGGETRERLAEEIRADMKGRFRFVAPAGRGCVAFTAFDESYHRKASRPAGYSGRSEFTLLMSTDSGPEFHALEKINLDGQQDEYEVELTVERGEVIAGQLLDPAGQPITAEGGRYFGHLEDSRWHPLDHGKFQVLNFDAERPRQLLFVHPELKLAGKLELEKQPESPLRVQLARSVAITGRVVDEDGAPIEDLSLGSGMIKSWLPQPGRAMMSLPQPPPLPPAADGYSPVKTDADGKFVISGLVPGVEYDLSGSRHTNPLEYLTGDLAEGLKLSSGETRDLGTLVLQTVSLEEAIKRGQKEIDAAKASEEVKAEDSRKADKPAEVTIRGRVLDPAGQPFAGAKIFTPRWLVKKPTLIDHIEYVQRAVSDAEGLFSFATSPDDLTNNLGRLQVSGFASGYGIVGVQVPLDEKQEEITLQLVPDKIVRGRVIDPEGRPVAGVTLRVDAILIPQEGQLDEFLSGWTQGWQDATHRLSNRIFMLSRDDQFCSANTDQQGQFELHGIGAERVAWLTVLGAGVAQARLFVVTHDGVDYDALNKAAIDHIPNELLLPGQPVPLVGSTFDHIAEPANTIEAVVLDSETGEPISNAIAGSLVGYDCEVTAKSDEKGRFRLTGLPQRKSFGLFVQPPDGSALLQYTTSVDNPPGLEPIPVEIKLQRGVLVTGQVIDRQTGQGVASGLQMVPLPGNEWYEKPGFDLYRRSRMSDSTDQEGRFRLVSMPGPVVMKVQTAANRLTIGDRQVSPYLQAEFDAADREKVPVTKDGEDRYFTAVDNSIEFLDNQNAVKYLDLKLRGEPTECTLYVDRGRQAEVKLLDDEGNPLAGTVVAGMADCWPITFELPESNCTLLALNDQRHRDVLFFHRGRHLAGSMKIKAGETPPGEYRLEPTKKIIGRAVDSDGEPLSGEKLELWFDNNTASDLERFLAQSRDPLTTDEAGKFQLDEIVPGYPLRMACGPGDSKLISPRIDNRLQDYAEGVLDLGDVTMRLRSELTAAKQAQKSLPANSEELAHSVRGRVNMPDDQPAPGAHVAVIAMRAQARSGGDLSPPGVVLAEGTTDASGEFRLPLTEVSSQTHRDAYVIARKDGLAIAWQRLNLDAQGTEVQFALRSQEPIRGRLIDLESKPADSVHLYVQIVSRRNEKDSLSQDRVDYRGGANVPASWFQPITSDTQGRFTIKGVPSGYGVYLHVEGNERFAPQDIAINTGMSEQRGDRDGTYRPLVKNLAAGETAVLPLAPAQIFEGRVTYADTGEPAPHARLTIWASQQAESGSMYSVEGHADAQGRYHILPQPGIRFGINAYPPEGTPYLAWQMPYEEVIHWQDADRIKHVDIELPRGVLVRGRILEDKSGKGIEGATVQYIPESNNNSHVSKTILTGWQGIKLSDEAGNFEISVLPGLGRLLVHAPHNNYVMQSFGSRELSRGMPGGERVYVHAVEKIDPEPNSNQLDLNITLRRGETVQGTVVDEEGQRVDEVIMVWRYHIYPGQLNWRADHTPILGGEFELTGLELGQAYDVHFLDAQRRLGATAQLGAEDPSPTVVLEPCGEAEVRFVDQDGQPVANDYYPSLEIVVTPGPLEDYSLARRMGALTADADFVSNIDRVNYSWPRKTDSEGRVLLPALIPGATYRLRASRDGTQYTAASFQVKAGEKLDLGDIVFERRD